jgi:nitroreductase
MSSTYDTIRTKRDTRAYTQQPIPDDVLERILRAGRRAGSAKHAQPVRFVVVTDPDHKQELASCGNFTPHLVAAPLGIALALLPPGDQFDPRRAAAFDAGRAAQNMMLAAWAEGVASCPVTMHRGTDAARVLRLPEGHEVIWVLVFGYPAPSDVSREPRSRLPLAEYVHHEYWQ